MQLPQRGASHPFTSLPDLGRSIDRYCGGRSAQRLRASPAREPGRTQQGRRRQDGDLEPHLGGPGKALQPRQPSVAWDLEASPPASPPRPGDPAPFAPRRPLPGRAPERAALLTGARAGSCCGRLAAAGLLARAALAPPSCSGAWSSYRLGAADAAATATPPPAGPTRLGRGGAGR